MHLMEEYVKKMFRTNAKEAFSTFGQKKKMEENDEEEEEEEREEEEEEEDSGEAGPTEYKIVNKSEKKIKILNEIQSEMKKLKAIEILRVPGKVYYFYQNHSNLKYSLIIGNSTLKALARLWPTAESFHHHDMSAYRNTLRVARLQTGFNCPLHFVKLQPYHTKKNGWEKCKICGQDPMWFYKLQTNSDKGNITIKL